MHADADDVIAGDCSGGEHHRAATPTCRTVPHTAIPNRPTQCHTMSYHTISYHLIACYTIAYLSYHVIPCHTMPYHAIPYHTMPCCHTIPYRTLLYHPMPRRSYYTLPYHRRQARKAKGSGPSKLEHTCHSMSYHAIPCHTMPYHIIPCHAAIPYHTVPYFIIPCHVAPTIRYHTVDAGDGALTAALRAFGCGQLLHPRSHRSVRWHHSTRPTYLPLPTTTRYLYYPLPTTTRYRTTDPLPLLRATLLYPLPSTLPSTLYPRPLPSTLYPLPSTLYPLSLYPLPSTLYPLPSTCRVSPCVVYKLPVLFADSGSRRCTSSHRVRGGATVRRWIRYSGFAWQRRSSGM